MRGKFALVFVPETATGMHDEVNRMISGLINDDAFRDNIGNHRDSATKLKWRLNRAEEIGRYFI